MDLEGISYIDISPTLNESTGVFPGDVSFKRRVTHSTEKGDHMTLSSIESTLHVGAHADGPNHYSKTSEGIGERSLEYYLGPCQVIDLSDEMVLGGKIILRDLERVQLNCARVLFKTETFNHQNWNDDFVYISEAVMKYLVDKGVKLVGIDTPSIDKVDSKNLEAHRIVAENNMAILEGLDLSYAEQGDYQIIALPLKIENADASPVRAILIPR